MVSDRNPLDIKRAVYDRAQPELSSGFDRKLARRLQPRHPLSATGRQVMALYTLASLLFSVWFMRRESLNWGPIAIAIAVPLIVIAVTTILRRQGHLRA
jgi:hypothetical protein